MGDADAHAGACAPPVAWRRPFGLHSDRRFLPRNDHEPIAGAAPEDTGLLAIYRNTVLAAAARAELLTAIRRRHGAALLDQAIHGLARRFPELSAQRVLSRPQVAVGILLGLLLLAALVLSPSRTWLVLVWTLSLAFGLNGAFRALLALVAPRALTNAPPCDEPLPTYTLLVPLYREADVLPQLVDSLLRLDYPRALLDIKLVVEEDDAETVAAARTQAARDDALEVIEVPVGGPRTKPKAANYALAFARGEYLVVYDAEDRPEPDQLKKSAAAFRAGPRALACLQARLHIRNGHQNWLVGVLSQVTAT